MLRKIAILLGLLLVAVLSYRLWANAARRHSKWFLVATNIGQDSLRRFRLKSGQIGQDESIQRDNSHLPVDLKNINLTYRRYVDAAGLNPEKIRGMTVLELGPGFNIGIPLHFLADGAEKVVGSDKFVPLQTSGYFVELYRSLRRGLTDDEKARFDQGLRLSDKVEVNPQRVQYIYGKEVDELVSALGRNSMDLIVSNAVMEEIHDFDTAFSSMDQLLKPGGYMVHRIDLRDYGMFSKYGYHPLEFLTIPDWAYERMVMDSGQPNRKLVNDYRAQAARLGYRATYAATAVLGRPGEIEPPIMELKPGVDYGESSLQLVQEIRPRLLPRYQSLPDADLVVRGIVFVARKPGGQQ
jgi:SAM-dependent methyltransferase